MKQLRSLPTSLCCCLLLGGFAAAETCDQRYPGSCRVEVSTSIVGVKGEPAQQARSPRQVKQSHRAKAHKSAKRSRPAHRTRVAAAAARPRGFDVVASVPLPRPSPRNVGRSIQGDANGAEAMSEELHAKPGIVVDDAFNVLTTSDASDTALERALMARRDQMLGFASRGSDW